MSTIRFNLRGSRALINGSLAVRNDGVARVDGWLAGHVPAAAGSPTMYLTMEATAIASGLLDRQFGVRGGAEVTAPATKAQLILDHLLGRSTPRGA